MDMRWYLTMILLCISPKISDTENHVLVGHLNIFFGEISVQVLCSFLNQVVWFLLLLGFRNSLYILDINPLSDIWFENIFSHYVDCLFILL